jgi:hypothetical protein
VARPKLQAASTCQAVVFLNTSTSTPQSPLPPSLPPSSHSQTYFHCLSLSSAKSRVQGQRQRLRLGHHIRILSKALSPCTRLHKTPDDAMAIIESHPHIRAEIISNGAPLPEFVNDDEEDAPDTVTKYIEAESGAEFAVHVTLTAPYPETSILYEIKLDGKHVRGFFSKENNYNGQSVTFKTPGVSHRDGEQWFVSKFCFSSLVIGTYVLPATCIWY